jgi:hypothetical protein
MPRSHHRSNASRTINQKNKKNQTRGHAFFGTLVKKSLFVKPFLSEYGVTRKELDQFGKAVDEHIAHERRAGKLIKTRKR